MILSEKSVKYYLEEEVYNKLKSFLENASQELAEEFSPVKATGNFAAIAYYEGIWDILSILKKEG